MKYTVFVELMKLTKPGIIFGNIITLLGAFFYSLKIQEEELCFSIFFYTILGLIFVIASACVMNNYLDRDIDVMMKRTQHRISTSNKYSLTFFIFYSCILLILGLVFLLKTNFLTELCAVLGWVIYITYTFLKKQTIFSTYVGAISGAFPPIIGYLSLSNNFDYHALILFLILFCWQIPHFYSISIIYKEEYNKAQIPILPIKKGINYTKINILLFTILYNLCSYILFFYEKHIYSFIVIMFCGLFWIMFSIKGFFINYNIIIWARKMFLLSIINITVLSFLLAI